MCPNYSFQCQNCQNLWVENRKSAERDDPAPCLACDSGNTYRCIDIPNLIQKAAYLDGTRRLDKFKEAAKLNTEAATAGKERKKEIQKEIRKLGVRMNRNAK